MAIQIYGPPDISYKWASIDSLFANSVVELTFRRRNPKMFWNNRRGMLCTNSWNVLNSIPGKAALHYVPPKGVGLRYNPQAKNLKVTWDIFKQEFRQINLDDYTLLAVMPVRTRPELQYFWQYFADRLKPMSASNKISYMNTRFPFFTMNGLENQENQT